MIILFAMINSLAAREKARRAAPAPPDRTTWGVYAGDGKTRELEAQRRRSELFRRHRVEAKLPRRRVATAAEKIRHRDIVNLKPSVTRHAALQEAPFGADVTTSVQAGRVHDPPAALASAKQSSDRLGPASNSNIDRGGCRNSAQIRNALYVGASGCIGKFFSRL